MSSESTDMLMSKIAELTARVMALEADKEADRPFGQQADFFGRTFIPETSVDETEFSFKTVSNLDNTATMTEGDIWLGPDTQIAWASITNASTTVTVGGGESTWYVWLVVDVSEDAETAEWFEGNALPELTSEEKKTKVVVPLVKITADGATPSAITGVKHLQCGDVLIPRL